LSFSKLPFSFDGVIFSRLVIRRPVYFLSS
jgi:hypothetical protein